MSFHKTNKYSLIYFFLKKNLPDVFFQNNVSLFNDYDINNELCFHRFYFPGVKYLNECPRQRKIPIYLLVGGCFGMLKVIGTVWHNIQSKRYEDLDIFYDGHMGDGAFASRTYKMMDMLLSTFLFSWLIAGTYWVFPIWEPNYHQLLYEPSDWCDRTVYLFAAYQILACYGFLCFILLLICILALCHKYTSMFHSR